jgi:hypothetical protein
MILKPGKPLQEVSSYRLISLLWVLSKIFIKAILKTLRPILEENWIVLDHQLGCWQLHSTIEQIYLISETIRGTWKKAVLLWSVPSITEAFDDILYLIYTSDLSTSDTTPLPIIQQYWPHMKN